MWRTVRPEGVRRGEQRENDEDEGGDMEAG